MRKLFAAVLLVTLLLAQATIGQAHNPGIFAFFSYQPETGFTVRLGDIYNAAVEGAAVTARVKVAGRAGEERITLKEGEPGIYTGTLRSRQPGLAEVTLEAVVLEELFQAVMRIDTGEPTSETILPMVEIGPAKKPFQWNWVLFPAAVVLLGGLTWGALRKRRSE